ncbi:MAG: Nif3-like dinuclear metal center hexameric protein [Flavobacteriales bacterium]|jgi:dinuclear metal center YbgI/SA1388 family protein|nr:Nif3-like dinuclear metal center hexameric protein [Flavobacteriales bacterium]
MKIKELTHLLEQWAPPSYQESYDNARLIVGNPQAEITGVIISLDCVEDVVEEAIQKGCNLVVSHHPIVFKGLKSLTGKNYVERTVLKAIKNDIALYAIHTNLDAVMTGVNAKFAQKLGLENYQILAPKSSLLKKMEVFVPKTHAKEVQNALFEAGAGNIGNYDQCSFNTQGQGTFRAKDQAKPFVGNIDERHEEHEVKIEVIFEKHQEYSLVQALKQTHPYEEVAYYILSLENSHTQVGSGMVGMLPEPMPWQTFFNHIKTTFGVEAIKHTKPIKQEVQKIALCGGSGSFLLAKAKGIQADVFVTGDFKYHEFFDAEDQIMIADIGHYESEHLTIELIDEFIREKNCTFAIYRSEQNTNPISFF